MPDRQQRNQNRRVYAILRCQGCQESLLGIIDQWNDSRSGERDAMVYVKHYPMGKPDDDVPEEIPEHIAADYVEALRCRWVNSFNATAEMCRRALQASCLLEGAPRNKKLVHQIKWLLDEGRITKPLYELAERIRLGGNLGAHPPDDPEDPPIVIGEKEADAILEFCKDYFQHIYIMPKRLEKYTFSKNQQQSENPD